MTEGWLDTATDEQLLTGIRVLDLCRDLSGPYTAMMLAELGADVIELEHPTTGDETRSWPPLMDGFSGYFATVNRSKRSLALDLKSPQGVEIVLELASRSDVVMQSFTPGVADRLGVGYEAVRAINPGVVYYSLSGFGQDGPWRERRGYDPILQAISGHMSVMGEKGGLPVKSMVPTADLFAAIHGYAAILGALLRRERTSRGQQIDLSMLDVMVSVLSVVGTRYLHTGQLPMPHGTENPGRVPSAAFECADGRMLQLVPNQRQWADFCRVIARPGWETDPRFATPSARVDNAEALMPELRAVMRTRTASEWEQLMRTISVACAPINNLAEVFSLDQVRHRGLVQEYALDDGRVMPGLALPFRYSETPSQIRRRPPGLGEHTAEILRELGRSDEEIRKLLATSVVRGDGDSVRRTNHD
jgi:crotonobetainyl-CoA:carnitine CoA-transferase CaiB-like acyl-CoA transferase